MDDQDGIRPNSVGIRLTDDKGTVDRTITLTKNDDWAGSFTDLDNTLNYNVSIEKTGVINGVDGKGTYAYTISGNPYIGFYIRLTHTPTIPGVAGSIAWDDNDNLKGKRPSSVTVTLMARLDDGTVINMSTGKCLMPAKLQKNQHNKPPSTPKKRTQPDRRKTINTRLSRRVHATATTAGH